MSPSTCPRLCPTPARPHPAEEEGLRQSAEQSLSLGKHPALRSPSKAFTSCRPPRLTSGGPHLGCPQVRHADMDFHGLLALLFPSPGKILHPVLHLSKACLSVQAQARCNPL